MREREKPINTWKFSTNPPPLRLFPRRHRFSLFLLYSFKLWLLLFRALELLLCLLLPLVELLWFVFALIGLGFAMLFCDMLLAVLLAQLRRLLIRCWSVVSKPLRTSWLGIFLANNNRFTESSYVRRATIFCRRNPWQYSMSFDAL